MHTISLATDHLPLTTLPGIPLGAEPLALAGLLAKSRIILHVAVSDRAMAAVEGTLRFFAPQAEVLRFPAWDCLPYDRASPLASIMAERISTLSTLAEPLSGKQRVVLTTVSAVLQKLPPRDLMRQATISLRRGDRIQVDELAAKLTVQGYRRSAKAMEPGEFALRGGIVDIVAPGMEGGIRLDLFGDDIETLRVYDPLTQLSRSSVEEVTLHPASEVMLDEIARERFRERYRELFGAVVQGDPLYEAISQGGTYPGMEHWLPLFYEKTDTLFDYCGDALLTLGGEATAALHERFESIRDYYAARMEAAAQKSGLSAPVYHPLPPEHLFLIEESWQAELEKRESMQFSPFYSSPRRGEVGRGASSENISSISQASPHPNPPPAGEGTYRPILPFARNLNPFDQLRERMSAAPATLLACFSEGSRQRFFTLLAERGFHPQNVDAWQDIFPSPARREGMIYLAVLPMERGFATDAALVVSEQDVLGERIARVAARKKKPELFLAEASNLSEGELVVHREHGIGRFEGLIAIDVHGAAHDCLKLIYDGGDRLFLPVENIDMVTRFGLDEEGAQLDKLGGAGWQSRKARLKERITLAAEALLKTAAERQVKQGAVIDPPVSYDDFCARFPYAETDDQARAIADVLEDLQRGRPMDRLVCGDVGFGKTEVALRAAFVVTTPSPLEGEGGVGGGAIDSDIKSAEPPLPLTPSLKGRGKFQVALICPTTLLARQHTLNFRRRFEGFPVRIAQLSRIVPAREQQAVREKLASGEIDIVIGTHALLAKNIRFKNLGLLIVDEEQHFGVAQKEKLKSLKSDVHVLTLTATPIPRTLQMAMSGVRDLSLIATPPVDRLAIRSFVMPFDPVVVKEALARERHRGGKSFIVCPRIKDMAEAKARLIELMPDLKLAVAHGQIAAGALDKIMNDFYDGEYDALLSTAIIESGLDIEGANTMIVMNAHLFGLSQLYQLRGRVGRGKQRAYAYFILPHHRELTKNATRRLEVMQTLDSLGAGFTLASHDMDIRGFGNLVGEEQSGHIREVGIELYQQMLEEAVSILRRGEAESAGSMAKDPAQSLRASQDWSPAINLGLSVLIPESYVGDLPLRLGLYRRAANLASEQEIDAFAAEMVDRFGRMPEEMEHLIAVLGIKLLCKRAGIERIDVGPKGAVITLRNNTFSNPEALLAYIARTRNLKPRPDQKLVLTQEWKDDGEKLTAVRKLAGEIAELLA